MEKFSWNTAYLSLHNDKCIRRAKWPLYKYIGISDNQLYWCYIHQHDENTMEYIDVVEFSEICSILFDDSLYNDWEIW